MGDFIVKKSIILAILCMFVANNIGMDPSEESRNELMDLAQFMMTENAPIQEWQTTWKESISPERKDALVKMLSRKYEKSVTKDEKKVKISFKNRHISKGINVLFNVVIPRHGNASAEFIAVISGNGWNSNTEENYTLINQSFMNKYFTNSVRRFACLTTRGNDIINGDYFLTKLTNYFQVEQIQTQFDTVEQSTHKKIIYGYTPLWKQRISIEDAPMNIQIAVEENGSDNPTYMIGTPILINEY